MRIFSALTALTALTVAVVVAGCSTAATSQPGQSASDQPTLAVGPAPSSPAPSSVVTATCTDRVSDAATLQQAIDSSATGSLIQITGPVCLLVSGITFLSDRTYAGYSTTGTVLEQDGPMKFVLGSAAYTGNSPYTGEPVAIRDLTVECNGSGSTDGIIVLNWQANVEEVDVRDCGGSGIVDTNTTADGQAIRNTSVNSRFDNNFITNSREYGFEVRDSDNSVTDGFLEDNQIAYSGLDAIHLENAAGWDISGNNLYSVSRNAIYANRLFGTTISNNYIGDFGSTQGPGNWYGIVATIQGGLGSTIFNNKIFNAKGESRSARYTYLGITAANYGTGYLSVTGNVIVGVQASDVGLYFSGGSHKLVVASSGNEVANVGTVIHDAPSVTRSAGT